MSKEMVGNNSLFKNRTTIGPSETFDISKGEALGIQLTFDKAVNPKVNFKGSSDGTNWFDLEGVSCDKKDMFVVSGNKAQVYSFEVPTHAYFRLEIETLTSGSVSAYATLFSIS